MICHTVISTIRNVKKGKRLERDGGNYSSSRDQELKEIWRSVLISRSNTIKNVGKHTYT